MALLQKKVPARSNAVLVGKAACPARFARYRTHEAKASATRSSSDTTGRTHVSNGCVGRRSGDGGEGGKEGVAIHMY